MAKKSAVRTWRLTSEEANHLKEMAAAEGITESELIYRKVFGEASLLHHIKQIEEMLQQKEKQKKK